MLIRIHRNIVFIHDTYIFASNLLGRVYREIPFLVMPHISKKKRRLPAIETLSWITKYGLGAAREKFYEEMEVIESVREELRRKLEEIEPRNIFEYIIRGLPRNTLQTLAKLGYIWLIPFKNISSISIEEYKGAKIIRIDYLCPLTNTRRIFKTIYDQEVYDLIKKLYLYNKE